MARRRSKPKIRRSSLFALLLLTAISIVMGYMLHQMNGELALARTEEAFYAERRTALQETNTRLANDIANSDDPSVIEEIARNELGMVFPGEKLFRFQN